MANQPRSMFGGSFFGKPIPLAGASAPQVQAPAPQVQAQPHPAPQAQSPRPAIFGPSRVPLGDKGDCPVCH